MFLPFFSFFLFYLFPLSLQTNKTLLPHTLCLQAPAHLCSDERMTGRLTVVGPFPSQDIRWNGFDVSSGTAMWLKGMLASIYGISLADQLLLFADGTELDNDFPLQLIAYSNSSSSGSAASSFGPVPPMASSPPGSPPLAATSPSSSFDSSSSTASPAVRVYLFSLSTIRAGPVLGPFTDLVAQWQETIGDVSPSTNNTNNSSNNKTAVSRDVIKRLVEPKTHILLSSLSLQSAHIAALTALSNYVNRNMDSLLRDCENVRRHLVSLSNALPALYADLSPNRQVLALREASGELAGLAASTSAQQRALYLEALTGDSVVRLFPQVKALYESEHGQLVQLFSNLEHRVARLRELHQQASNKPELVAIARGGEGVPVYSLKNKAALEQSREREKMLILVRDSVFTIDDVAQTTSLEESQRSRAQLLLDFNAELRDVILPVQTEIASCQAILQSISQADLRECRFLSLWSGEQSRSLIDALRDGFEESNRLAKWTGAFQQHLSRFVPTLATLVDSEIQHRTYFRQLWAHYMKFLPSPLCASLEYFPGTFNPQPLIDLASSLVECAASYSASPSSTSAAGAAASLPATDAATVLTQFPASTASQAEARRYIDSHSATEAFQLQLELNHRAVDHLRETQRSNFDALRLSALSRQQEEKKRRLAALRDELKSQMEYSTQQITSYNNRIEQLESLTSTLSSSISAPQQRPTPPKVVVEEEDPVPRVREAVTNKILRLLEQRLNAWYSATGSPASSSSLTARSSAASSSSSSFARPELPQDSTPTKTIQVLLSALRPLPKVLVLKPNSAESGMWNAEFWGCDAPPNFCASLNYMAQHEHPPPNTAYSLGKVETYAGGMVFLTESHAGAPRKIRHFPKVKEVTNESAT